jgi:hypothetical protein
MVEGNGSHRRVETTRHQREASLQQKSQEIIVNHLKPGRGRDGRKNVAITCRKGDKLPGMCMPRGSTWMSAKVTAAIGGYGRSL